MDDATESRWASLMGYFELMTNVTLRQTGQPVAIAVNAFMAGLVLMENEPKFAKELRRVMEAAAAEEAHVTPEQMEVAIRSAFDFHG